MLLFTSNIFAKNSTCIQNALTDKDVQNCISIEAKQSEKLLNKYLKASVEQYFGDDKTIQNIEQTQKIWQKYKNQQCNSVYDMWQGASVTFVEQLSCQVRLNRYRAYELWSVYLTYADSTLPVLKKPKL
jgi:uncharacterized protein YecT (DUF1311 family)